MSRDGTMRMAAGTGVLITDAGGALVLRHVVVRVVSGEDRGKELLLVGGSVTIGSHPGADLCLTDSTVSRYHAELSLLPEGVHVRDLQSTNGTFLADSKIESATVPHGAQIRVGRTHLQCVPADVPAPEAPADRDRFGRLSGDSAAMRTLFAQLEKAAQSEAPVLLIGEPGTGKSEAARALHAASGVTGPLVVLELGSGLSDSDVAEAFVSAEGGSVVLDGVDLAPGHIQEALVRALDRRERGLIRVRPIATARSDLRARVEEGALRRDLFFHIAALRLVLPPLRERLEDLPRLVTELMAEAGYPGVRLSPTELGHLRAHDFPGNLRELRRTIEGSRLLRPGGSSDGLAAVDAGRGSGAEAGLEPTTDPGLDPELHAMPYKEAKETLLLAFEKSYIERLLERSGGNISQAAADAGIDRNHLTRLAKKHGLR